MLARLLLIVGVLGLWLPLAHAQDAPTATPVPVAALRLSDVPLEVRAAAPPGWHYRAVTEQADFPTALFLEHDPDAVPIGGRLGGAVIQVSLVSPSYLRSVMDSVPDDDLALAYLNHLIGRAAAGIALDEVIALGNGETPYRGIWLDATYADGRQQVLVIIQAEAALLMVTIYAPDETWEAVAPLWEAVLAGMLVNGEVLPSDFWAGAF